MAFSTDFIIVGAIGIAAAILLGLLLSIWRWIAARREVRRLRNHIGHREQQLQQQGELARHLEQDNHRKDIDLGRQASDLANLRQRLQEKLDEQQRLQREFENLQHERNRSQQDYARLQAEQRERESRYLEQIELLNETRDDLKKEFEHLANKIFEDKGKRFTSTSQASLEVMLKPFREQISGFQARIDQVHSESIKGNTALEKEIQKVLEIGLEMNSQASNLTTALKGDKKTTGNWGEAQLERTLELAGLQPGEHYDTQAAFKDEAGKRKLPDFVIRLPDGKNLVIDAKVSLVDYDRAIAADTEEARGEALAAHARAVRNHIDDLASKDYANLPGIGSPDFVLMFMPIEPAYIEAMKENRDLFNYGYNKGVVMVSHTTLMPILRTVANLWMVDKSNKEARDISDRAGDLYNQVARVVERFGKLGNSLRAVQGHYNDTLTSLVGQQGLRGKTDKFREVSARANKQIPEVEPIADDLELERLEVIALQGEETQPAPADAPEQNPDNVQPLNIDKRS